MQQVLIKLDKGGGVFSGVTISEQMQNKGGRYGRRRSQDGKKCILNCLWLQKLRRKNTFPAKKRGNVGISRHKQIAALCNPHFLFFTTAVLLRSRRKTTHNN